jgi:hypothetical protein
MNTKYKTISVMIRPENATSKGNFCNFSLPKKKDINSGREKAREEPGIVSLRNRYPAKETYKSVSPI